MEEWMVIVTAIFGPGAAQIIASAIIIMIIKVIKWIYNNYFAAAAPTGAPAAASAAAPGVAEYEKYWQCDEIFNKTVQFLEKFKPDILIISQKLGGNDNFKKPLNSSDAYPQNKATMEVSQYFRMFSTFTQKIFVIEPHPTCSFNPALTLAKKIAQEKDISKHNLPLNKIEAQIDPGWLRIKVAMKECPKCVPIDVRNAYIENGKYILYDSKTKLSLFCDNSHFSPPGVERMLPALKKSFNQALKELIL